MTAPSTLSPTEEDAFNGLTPAEKDAAVGLLNGFNRRGRPDLVRRLFVAVLLPDLLIVENYNGSLTVKIADQPVCTVFTGSKVGEGCSCIGFSGGESSCTHIILAKIYRAENPLRKPGSWQQALMKLYGNSPCIKISELN